jgi:DNA-binding response OmpR family regulator
MVGILSRAGAHVIGPAATVKRAFELAEQEELHCSVLDVRLKDGLAFPVAEALRKRGLNIVFYTGQADPEEINREWPDAKVLQKPAPPALLQAIVEACVPC